MLNTFEPLPNSPVMVVINNVVEAVCNGNDKNLMILLKAQKPWYANAKCPGDNNVNSCTSKEIKRTSIGKIVTPTALHIAAAKGYSRCLSILCDNIENHDMSMVLNAQDEDGHTALHMAAQYGHNQCCREILRRGCKTNYVNNYGDTALHTACRYGHAGIARILISGYSNVNMTNRNGDTPLHITCAMGRKKLTKIILEARPDVTIHNSQSETPLMIAKKRNFIDIILLLQIYMDKCKAESSLPPGTVSTSSSSPFIFNNFEFSPYGCQNLDNRLIFFTNLQLPDDNGLGKDEEYYIDLAGNLKKGPKCVTNACVCNQLLNI